ncbi:YggT family protein [Thalassotalea aquiviva]|uniref:YggT family protein n=1 Tax=Thalassotalea aquiviva TaxID=3242415 RepID=UPI00352AF580
MEAVIYLLNFAFGAYVMLLVLRVWLQAVRADFYNPFSQFVVKATNPVVVPFRRFIPGFAGLDIATLLVAFIIACSKYAVLTAVQGAGIDVVSILFIGLLFLIKQAGTLLFMIMLIMALMSWVVQSPSPVQYVFHQLTEPFLRPIRKILPDLGGIDLSVLVAFLILNVINILITSVIPVWAYI